MNHVFKFAPGVFIKDVDINDIRYVMARYYDADSNRAVYHLAKSGFNDIHDAVFVDYHFELLEEVK